jgi:hypothetical protein
MPNIESEKTVNPGETHVLHEQAAAAASDLFI